MMQYTTEVLENFVRIRRLDKETQSDIFLPLFLTVRLIDDNLSVQGANELWAISNTEIRKEMTDLLSRGTTLKNKWLRDLSWRDSKGYLNYTLVRSIFDRWMTDVADDSSCAYYYAEARASTVSDLVNRN